MFTTVNSIKLYYEEFGDGDVLIFLHGNGEDLNIFKNSIDFFSKKYKIIAVDSRGHGKSETGAAPLTIPSLAKDIIELIFQNKLTNVSLVGFSDGGNIAIEVASELSSMPNIIKKIVVVGANLNFNGLKTIERVKISILEIFYNIFSFIPQINKQLKIIRLMTEQPEISDEKLNRIKAEVLVIAGEFDMIKQTHTEKIHGKINNSKLEIIKNGDHFLFSKKNNEINKIIDEFISN